MKIPSSKEELLQNLETLINQTYKVEKEFIELKNILNGVIEFLPHALWVIDEKGEIIVKNSKADEFDFIPNEGEIEYKGKFFLIQSSKIKNKTIISATDITEQKRNERLIAMGQMAAHLAHEIRNPIASINIFLSLLQKKCPKDIIYSMKSAIFRVERIIKSTLLFSKGINLRIKKFHLQDLISELKEIIKYYEYSKEIEFIFTDKNPEIKADYDLLLLVFQNLIFNAIDSIEEDEKEKGEIRFLYEKNNYHIFKILDSGKDFENRDILFEPFKSTKTKGHGLGLALSKEIINKHKGEIKLCEKEKGFKITIPLAYKQDYFLQ